MIVTRTPFRVSLFGGGTDYPDWYRRHGGAVLGMAIDKYCYLTVRSLPPFFEHKHRIVYSSIELVRSVEEIRHPVVRAVLADENVEGGLEIHHDADLPARSGLGSSSAFTVGFIHALSALRGRMCAKRDLADRAIRVERDVLKENVGSQDQIWAAFGGFNRIDFRRDGSYAVAPIVVSPARRDALRRHLMLVFTGFSRVASEVAADKIANLGNRAAHLHRMRELVDEAERLVADDGADIAEIGRLLHDNWRLKRDLSKNVSSGTIDAIYEAGRAAGAIGGKLLGAGAGGFMLFLARPEDHERIRFALSKLIHVSFGIDNDGSKVLVYEPNGFSG